MYVVYDCLDTRTRMDYEIALIGILAARWLVTVAENYSVLPLQVSRGLITSFFTLKRSLASDIDSYFSSRWFRSLRFNT